MPVPVHYTAAMVRDLPDDGRRYETVRGELLVSPAPRERHQRALGRLFLALGNFLERYRVGALYSSPSDVSWGPDILVQPDLFVVALDEARTGDWARFQTLLLAVEVLSPSSVRADRQLKRRLYQENGVAVYWVVDTDEQLVEVWTPEATAPMIEREQVTWHPAGAAEPLVIAVPPLFAEV